MRSMEEQERSVWVTAYATFLAASSVGAKGKVGMGLRDAADAANFASEALALLHGLDTAKTEYGLTEDARDDLRYVLNGREPDDLVQLCGVRASFARKMLEMTRPEASRAVGLPIEELARLEATDSEIPPATLRRFSEVYHVSAAWLSTPGAADVATYQAAILAWGEERKRH